jgi:Mor family transcriptional regulator
MPKIIKAQKQHKLIKSGYEDGLSTHSLAKEYNCSHQTIINILRKHGTVIRKSGTRGLPSNKIKEAYLSGQSSTKISEKYKVSVGSVLRCLRFNGVEISRCTALPMHFVIYEYISEGKSAYELGKKYGCSYATILRSIRREGFETRGAGAYAKQEVTL